MNLTNVEFAVIIIAFASLFISWIAYRNIKSIVDNAPGVGE